MATTAEALALALDYHQAGQLPDAEAIYRQILEIEPNHPDACHLLGVVAHQTGHHDVAIEHIHRAICLNETDPKYHNNLGEVYRAKQWIAEAVACYRRALELAPAMAAAHNNLGLALREQGQRNAAIACHRRALEHQPDFAEAEGNLGQILQEDGQAAEAIACYRRALALKPDYGTARNNLGALLMLQGEFAEATACFQHALQTMPDYADAHHNMGVALQDMGRAAEAIPWHEKALQIRPDYAEAHNGLGNARQWLGQMAEAAACYRRALELKPDSFEAHNNLGLALQNQGNVAEAIACYERALQLKPNFVDAHVNRSFAWLLTCDFERGWTEYEWRWLHKAAQPRSFRQPVWDGAAAPGKTILLHAEQGLGDTLQFIRYAPLVKRLVGCVVVECQERLLPLLAGCPGVDRCVARDGALPDFDFHAPLLSLPGLFRTGLASIPADIPYVSAPPVLVERWREKLSAVDGLRVGISWQGNPTYHLDHCRSMRLAEFAPLAQVPGARLISLQKCNGVEQIDEVRHLFAVEDLSRELDEQAGPFMDTAAIMRNLDLVVTSDSAIAHLAGSLGVAVWVALPLMPDWRWLLDRDGSPWYPTMRLFRQKRLGDWKEVFAAMASELRAVADGDRARLAPCGNTATPPVYVPMGAGELLDRIAILEIKLARITDADKLVRIRNEATQLCAVRDRVIAPCAELQALEIRLASVNERLWEIEDAIRGCEADKDFGPRFIELARSVYITNDERSAIKRQIDELLGSQWTDEKAYTPYAS